MVKDALKKIFRLLQKVPQKKKKKNLLDSGFASGFDLPRSRVKKFIVNNIREIDYRFSLNSAAVSTSTMAASCSIFFFNVRDSNPERSNDVNAADQAGCGAIKSNFKKIKSEKAKKKISVVGIRTQTISILEMLHQYRDAVQTKLHGRFFKGHF